MERNNATETNKLTIMRNTSVLISMDHWKLAKSFKTMAESDFTSKKWPKVEVAWCGIITCDTSMVRTECDRFFSDVVDVRVEVK